MNHLRTFRTGRLFHQFLKPKGISMEQLPFFVSKLYEAGFIDIFRDEASGDERYSENRKLFDSRNKKELFSIIESLV